jgi:hypothetical protein
MKYHQPYGVGDPQAPYINGDPSVGRQGSIIPAEAVEFPQRELTNFFNISNILPSDSDMVQLARSVQNGYVNFGTDTGTVNALQCVLSPPLIGTEYATGLMIRLKLLNTILNDVTHTSVTFNAGLGARNVVMPDGSLPPDQAMKGGGVYLFLFDGTRWQVIGAPVGGGGGGASTTYSVNIPYVNDTGPSSNNIKAIYAPPVAAITEGLFIAVKLAHPLITAVCNITVNTHPVKKIARANGDSPVAGDADTNQILLLCFDGVNFQIVGVMGVPVSRPVLRVASAYPYTQWMPQNGVTQIVGLNVILTNTLFTSTWNGTVLTVGNGEGGLWSINSIASAGNGQQKGVYTGVIRIRAGQEPRSASWGYGPAPAFASESAALGCSSMSLVPGDIVQVWAGNYGSSASPYYQPGNLVGGTQPMPNVEFNYINRP